MGTDPATHVAAWLERARLCEQRGEPELAGEWRLLAAILEVHPVGCDDDRHETAQWLTERGSGWQERGAIELAVAFRLVAALLRSK